MSSSSRVVPLGTVALGREHEPFVSVEPLVLVHADRPGVSSTGGEHDIGPSLVDGGRPQPTDVWTGESAEVSDALLIHERRQDDDLVVDGLHARLESRPNLLDDGNLRASNETDRVRLGG